MKTQLRKVRRSKLHRFHVRYRWVAVVAAVAGALFVWKGVHEIGTVSLGLAFEAALHHAVEFMSDEV